MASNLVWVGVTSKEVTPAQTRLKKTPLIVIIVIIYQLNFITKMGKSCRVNKRKRYMGNVYNSVNNVSAFDSVNIELPTINSNTANSTCVFEPIIKNTLNLSASSHKFEDLEGIIISKHGTSGY